LFAVLSSRRRGGAGISTQPARWALERIAGAGPCRTPRVRVPGADIGRRISARRQFYLASSNAGPPAEIVIDIEFWRGRWCGGEPRPGLTPEIAGRPDGRTENPIFGRAAGFQATGQGEGGPSVGMRRATAFVLDRGRAAQTPARCPRVSPAAAAQLSPAKAFGSGAYSQEKRERPHPIAGHHRRPRAPGPALAGGRGATSGRDWRGAKKGWWGSWGGPIFRCVAGEWDDQDSRSEGKGGEGRPPRSPPLWLIEAIWKEPGGGPTRRILQCNYAVRATFGGLRSPPGRAIEADPAVQLPAKEA